MKISRKYPIFMVLITIVTAGAIFGSLLGVLHSTLENEITGRGESTAEFLAQANGPLLLEQNHAQLQYNLAALSGDVFIINAIVANHKGRIVAALNKDQIGQELEIHLRKKESTRWFDSDREAYDFSAPIRYSGVELGTFVISLSRGPINAALNRVTKWALLIVAGIALSIAMFTVVLVRREIRPLRMMNTVLHSIAAGDFSQRVPVQRNDEIGDLAEGINHMLVRSELFFHYVDKMIIERLVADESLAQPGGRETNMAVLFGDMRGYTAMSNRRSANEVVRIVNTYFHIYIECIAHFGGMVDKTMGDAIMAVFEGTGDPKQSQHRKNAVMALAYMKSASRILNAFLKSNKEDANRLGLEPREWGFAMATGNGIVGNIGSRRRMDYTVCGRVVNLASRLEGLTKGGEVIIDNFAQLDTHHLVDLEALPAVQPKGFSPDEKVIPHRIVSLKKESGRKMRSYMKRLFSYSFVQEMLTPADLPESELHGWVTRNEKKIADIIKQMPLQYLFARANTETGQLLLTPETIAELRQEYAPNEDPVQSTS